LAKSITLEEALPRDNSFVFKVFRVWTVGKARELIEIEFFLNPPIGISARPSMV
jgi:hypothetical protein